jgi:16S rRNA (uracil1498-N3)-methyltransferase
MSEARRLFATELPATGGSVVLSEEQSRHARVLRLEPGHDVLLFDGQGRQAHAKVVALGKRLTCEAEVPTELPDDGRGVTLLLALPRAGKLDDILRAVTELGVREVHLCDCERSVGNIQERKLDAKLARYESVVREAARQCERERVPRVHAPLPLAEVAARAPSDPAQVAKIVLAARGDARLPAALPKSAWVAVGPEGGFSDAELDGLVQAGFAPCRVGRTILRVETAAIAGVALVAERFTD